MVGGVAGEEAGAVVGGVGAAGAGLPLLVPVVVELQTKFFEGGERHVAMV